jgi:predicted RNase H-like HicB family nuclease
MWKNGGMTRQFAASVWREGDWYVAQCLQCDIASQGETEDEALSNLKEALELYFEPPRATRPPLIRTIEVEVGAA